VMPVLPSSTQRIGMKHAGDGGLLLIEQVMDNLSLAGSRYVSRPSVVHGDDLFRIQLHVRMCGSVPFAQPEASASFWNGDRIGRPLTIEEPHLQLGSPGAGAAELTPHFPC
jgi:hypothetical protein